MPARYHTIEAATLTVLTAPPAAGNTVVLVPEAKIGNKGRTERACFGAQDENWDPTLILLLERSRCTRLLADAAYDDAAPVEYPLSSVFVCDDPETSSGARLGLGLGPPCGSSSSSP